MLMDKMAQDNFKYRLSSLFPVCSISFLIFLKSSFGFKVPDHIFIAHHYLCKTWELKGCLISVYDYRLGWSPCELLYFSWKPWKQQRAICYCNLWRAAAVCLLVWDCIFPGRVKKLWAVDCQLTRLSYHGFKGSEPLHSQRKQSIFMAACKQYPAIKEHLTLVHVEPLSPSSPTNL